MSENNSPLTTLVVDNDPVSLKLMSSLLTKKGYQVLIAKTGKEAVAVVEKGENIDFIITDVTMPVMDGFQFIHYLNADLHFSRIPVLVCSALNDMVSVKRAISLGAVDYISKPVNPQLLMEKIKKAENKISGSVLIVDDEELLRTMLSKVFTRDGNKVILAKSGSEALEKLAENKVSLVISDYVMPEMNGMELLAEIKTNFPKMPVILVTGHGSKCNKNEAMAAGAKGFITKPFKNAEILMQTRPFL